tara:strand:- start:994 stop:1404 length:411 start_codon:yes stop_codon:yes gene_type:complete
MFKNLLNIKKLKSPKKPMDFLMLALVMLCIYLVVKYLYKNVVREGLEVGKRLVFLHMDGCGHCEKFMPEWKKAVKSNKTGIKMVDYENSTPEGSKLAKKHNVTGFPSVMLLGTNKIKDYDGERTEAGLLSFLEENK